MTDIAGPTLDEVTHRIAEVTAHHGGRLPPDQAAAWSGYIAALLEWGLLTPDDHARLQDQLPPSAAMAVLPIFLGAEGGAIAAESVRTAPARAAG